MSELIADELRRLRVPDSRVSRAATELESVRQLLAWAEEGDLLVLPVHAERDAVLGLIADLSARDWAPGVALP